MTSDEKQAHKEKLAAAKTLLDECRKKACEEIDQKLKAAQTLLNECRVIAEENGVSFDSSLETYSDAEELEGWQSSSMYC